MKTLFLDASTIQQEQDGLGFYSTFLIERILALLPREWRIRIFISEGSKWIDQILRTYSGDIDTIESSKEFSMRVSFEEDLDLLNYIVSKVQPNIFISTAFRVSNYPCRQLVVIHDLAPLICRSILSKRKVKYYEEMLIHAINHASKIVVPSNCVRDDLTRIFGVSSSRIMVLFPDIRAVKNRISQQTTLSCRHQHRFVMVGVKCPRKNIELAINALALLKELGKPQKAYFVGHLRDEVPIHNLISTAGVDNLIEVLGYVPDQQLRAIIHSSIGLLFPSICEGFGLPLLEFLCANKPIICINRSAIPEVVGNAAFFATDSAESFAKAILSVQEHKYCHDFLKKSQLQISSLEFRNELQFKCLDEWIIGE